MLFRVKTCMLHCAWREKRPNKNKDKISVWSYVVCSVLAYSVCTWNDLCMITTVLTLCCFRSFYFCHREWNVIRCISVAMWEIYRHFRRITTKMFCILFILRYFEHLGSPLTIKIGSHHMTLATLNQIQTIQFKGTFFSPFTWTILYTQ